MACARNVAARIRRITHYYSPRIVKQQAVCRVAHASPPLVFDIRTQAVTPTGTSVIVLRTMHGMSASNTGLGSDLTITEERTMTDEDFDKANEGLCEGCYCDPCECLPDDAPCDPE